MLHELYIVPGNFLMESNFSISILALEMVRDGMAIGLCGGSTIATLIKPLAEVINRGHQLQLYTSSNATRLLLLSEGMTIHDQGHAKKLDIYFDGCDQLDKNLNALKSGGGIHTQEKILTAMSDQFILLADEKKWVPKFDTKFPLVIELLPDSRHYIPPRIEMKFQGCRTSFRRKNEDVFRTINGNFLLEVWFGNWPPLDGINEWLKSFPGTIETSLFYSMASTAIIGAPDGARIIRNN
jgi:ribose 5-phosphate isomerase A